MLPNLSWLLMILLLAPTFAMASIGLTVLISVRVKGFREAQQISVVLIFPIMGFVFSQIAGVAFFGPLTILSLAVVLGAIDAMIFRIGMRIFGRENIIERLV